jgi:alkaline phosphatase
MNYDKKMKKEDQFYQLYGSYDPLTISACHILSQKAGIGWTSFSHTASPIPVRSEGVGAHLFTGFFDNTDVAKNLMKLMERKK